MTLGKKERKNIKSKQVIAQIHLLIIYEFGGRFRIVHIVRYLLDDSISGHAFTQVSP
jgi:hypothetical protein